MNLTTPRSLSSIELAWVRIQTPENPAVTTVTLVCDETLDPTFIKTRIEDRLLPEKRLRQKLASSHLHLARPRWQEHDHFQLADHFFHPSGASPQPACLADIVSQLSSQPLDEELPLWQVHLVDHERGGSAIVLRLHAAVADSKAAAALALRLVDAEQPTAHTELGLEHLIALHSLGEGTGQHAAATRLLCRLITSRADRANPFRRQPAGPKTLDWSAPVDLGPIQSRASHSEFTATGFCLAAVVDALRKEIHRQDVPVEGLGLRAVVSLDLRQPGDPWIGTRAALGLLRLPLQDVDPADRLAAVQKELEHFSLAPERLTVLGNETGPSLSMSEIEERSIRLLSQKATVALNVLDGPTEPQALCGQPVTQLLWWPPLTGDTALGISLISYGGRLQFGVCCDGALGTDAAALVADMATAAADS